MKAWLATAPVHTMEDVGQLPSVPLESVRLLPDTSGLYIVMADGQAIYVGIAMASLRRRWKQHHRAYVFKEIPGVRVAYLEIEDGPPLWRAEEAACDGLSPVLNGTPVGTRPRKSPPPADRP
jgi:hypothetical protein